MSAIERVRAILTYDNASDLEARNGMLAAVLSHIADFPRCRHWRPSTPADEHRGAPICIPGEIVRRVGEALTTSLWLSGLVMGYLVVEFEVVVKAKKRCGRSR